MRAVVVAEFGGPEVLRLREVPDPVAAVGEVVVEHEAIGVNLVDTQHRAGSPYPVEAPLIVGIEAAGSVVEVGAGVEDVAVGDRVAYGGVMPGVYAERAAVAADQLIHLDDDTTTDVAAAALLHGWTAHMLAALADRVDVDRDVRRAVVLAAAGGTGSLLTQLLVGRGWEIIGITSGEEKSAYVTSIGAEAIDRRDGDVVEAVLDRSGGGVHAVFEGIGGAVFDQARRMLRPRGHLVSFGQTAGPVPAIDPALLSGISSAGGPGSLTLTWPTLNDHNPSAEMRRWRAAEVFATVASGDLVVRIERVDPLGAAADVHAALESGATIGKLLLDPSR
ncbi:MAG: zinc-binding dehydrogenase [Actinomycetota bacterium]